MPAPLRRLDCTPDQWREPSPNREARPLGVPNTQPPGRGADRPPYRPSRDSDLATSPSIPRAVEAAVRASPTRVRPAVPSHRPGGAGAAPQRSRRLRSHGCASPVPRPTNQHKESAHPTVRPGLRRATQRGRFRFRPVAAHRGSQFGVPRLTQLLVPRGSVSTLLGRAHRRPASRSASGTCAVDVGAAIDCSLVLACPL